MNTITFFFVMSSELPRFKNYTVDVRLRQFRKVEKKEIMFIGFDSVEGEQLLNDYITQLDKESEEFRNFIRYF